MPKRETPALGPCCICSKRGEDVRNLIMLDEKAPVPGTGWGCVVCDLPQDGALAVLCDECWRRFDAGEVELLYACKGYAGEGERIAIEALEGQHRHDRSRHPEAGMGPSEFSRN